MSKAFKNTTTKYIWTRNVILHEWKVGRESEIITWAYDEKSFTPVAKLKKEFAYSIVSDQLETPTKMYDSDGNDIWSCQLDSNGQIKEVKGNAKDCPFRFQGQYHDEETGLYYNHYRYYDAESGRYIKRSFRVTIFRI